METQNLIYLVSCAVNGVLPDAERVKTMNLDALYQEAVRHSLCAITAYALEAAGVRDPRFTHAKQHAAMKNAQMDMEMDAVLSELEAAGIWYMPLKGILLQYCYPVYGMREMSDHDILFDAARAGDVTSIMEKLGFRTDSVEKYAHDLYRKEPVCNFEMHRMLFNPDNKNVTVIADYYQNVKERLVKDEGNRYGYHFTPEDMYVYLTAHEYKHYEGKGTGLRSLLDIYVYLKKTPLDMDYVAAETEKLGLAKFEAQNRALAQRLFSGGEMAAADQDMLEYILSSGVYGTAAHKLENKIRKNGRGKIQYALHRFFVPVSKKNAKYAVYAAIYPFFYKWNIFLPLLPFYRTFRAMKDGRFMSEARAIKKVKI